MVLGANVCGFTILHYDLLTDIQWIRLRAEKEMFTIKYLTI
jgi:hypothetical protein